MEISQDLGFRPILFLRFNPDEYFLADKKIPSCWTINKQGLCVVSKSKKTQWQERLQKLKTEIEFWSRPENKLEKTIHIVPLFFDQPHEK
jgi:hypothetical protein